MESYDQYRRGVRSQAASPYSRTAQKSPYAFVGRNVESRFGRIHDPNSIPRCSWESGNYSNGGALRSVENYDANHEELTYCPEVGYQTQLNFISDSMETSYIQNLDPHQIRNLSLKETEEKSKMNSHRGDIAIVKEKQPSEFAVRRKETSSRLLTGSVEKVIHWFKLRNHFQLLLEVIASIVDVKRGKFTSEKWLIVQDEASGPTLQVVFYEIDRALPQLKPGDVVRCVGRAISKNYLQAFQVVLSSEQERIASQRLIFISSMVAEEALIEFSKK